MASNWNPERPYVAYDLGYDEGKVGIRCDPGSRWTPEQRDEWSVGYEDGLGDGGHEELLEEYRQKRAKTFDLLVGTSVDSLLRGDAFLLGKNNVVKITGLT